MLSSKFFIRVEKESHNFKATVLRQRHELEAITWILVLLGDK
jgi:hypothetical protein